MKISLSHTPLFSISQPAHTPALSSDGWTLTTQKVSTVHCVEYQILFTAGRNCALQLGFFSCTFVSLHLITAWAFPLLSLLCIYYSSDPSVLLWIHSKICTKCFYPLYCLEALFGPSGLHFRTAQSLCLSSLHLPSQPSRNRLLLSHAGSFASWIQRYLLFKFTALY